MTSSLASRKDAIRARLDEAFPTGTGYGYFDVRLARPRKHQPRSIKVTWTAFPFEDEVRVALRAALDTTHDVALDRTQVWSCGRLHDDAFEAWKDHEGNDHLVYATDECCGHDAADKVLPEDVEAELRAAGETLESIWCTPGNYVPCPTCGGGARRLDLRATRYTPCPDCVRLGTDRQIFPGILDLDVPEHRDFYRSKTEEARAKVRAEAARAQTKVAQALAQPATTASPTWLPLPSRAAGTLNNIPVAESVGCDYLTHADDPERRVCCSNEARWFEPATGLRVCARHKQGKGQ